MNRAARAAWLCLVLIAVGCAPAPEGLPDPTGVEAEPLVREHLVEATKDVRHDPSSAAKWGRLGEIYDIHRFGEQALACYARASELDPDDWRWPYFQGLVLRETDQAKANERFERAIALNPDYAPARFYLAMGYLLSERLDDAAAQFDKAVELDPALANAMIGRARVDLARGDTQAALERLREAVRVAPTEAAVHHNLAVVHRAMGQLDLAEAAEAVAATSPVPMQVAEMGSLNDPVREEVILREGASSRWLVHNARRVLTAGDRDRALQLLQLALEADPRSVAALLESARVYLGSGDLVQARQMVERAIEIDPGSAEAQAELGNILARSGLNDQAISAFERATEIDPRLGDAQNNLATLLFAVGRADEGLERLGEAAAALPGKPVVQYNLAAALMNRERYDEAIEVLRASLRVRPDSTENLYLLGSILGMRGRFEEAVDVLRQVIEREPGHLDARLDLAQALWELGRYDQAIRALRESHAAAPNDPAVSFRLAWALATCPADSARDGAEAVAIAQQLNELTSFGDPRLLDLLAAAQAETGDFESAATLARRAVQILERVLATNGAGQDRAAAESFTAAVRERARLYGQGRPFRDR